MSFAYDSIAAQTGQSFSNILTVTSHSDQAIVLEKAFSDSMALLRLPDRIELDAGQTRQFPIRYLASRSLIRNYRNLILARYRIRGSSQSLEAGFVCYSPGGSSVVLRALSPVTYMDARTGIGSLQIQCVNNDFKPVAIRLKTQSYPQGLEWSVAEPEFVLEPGTQRQVRLDFNSRRSGLPSTDFSLTISAIDPASGKEYATAFNKVILLSHEKRMTLAGTADAGLLNNTARVSLWNTNHDYRFYQLSGTGSVATAPGAQLGYRLHLNHYTRPRSGTEIYDSWLSYRNRHVGVHLGEISENLDYPIFGNGVKLSAFADSTTIISGYYIKSNYLLYSDITRQRTPATIWGAVYQQERSRHKRYLNYLRIDDPFTGVGSHLVNGRSAWLFRGDQYLELEAGYSHEQLDTARSKKAAGMALGVSYRNQLRRWSLQSENYYSSPYYSGLRRGVLLLQEHLGYQIAANRKAYADIRILHNTPEYLSEFGATSYHSRTGQYQLGYMTGQHRGRLNLRAYYYTQALKQQLLGNHLDLHSRSWHGAADLSIYRGAHSFLLSGDWGWVHSDNPYLLRPWYSVAQIRFSYTYKQIGFNSLYQYNPYYLIQEPMPWQPGQFRQFSMGPYLRFKLFRQKLEFEASDNLNYYGYVDNSWSNTAQGRIEYSLQSGWALSLMGIYNSYQQYPGYDYWQTRASITKSFMQYNAFGFHSLRVTFFADHNANGVRDDGEGPIEGVIVALDQSVAQSDRKGRLSFSNLKPAVYSLSIQSGKGWWLLAPVDVNMNRNRKMELGLVRTAVVSGRVSYEKNAFVESQSSLEGIRVEAIAPDGRRFTTLTDAVGYFSFNLPALRFSFQLESPTAGQSLGQEQVLDVKEQDNPQLVFRISDPHRKVHIKQF